MTTFGALDDDSVLFIASFGAAEDLLSLALTCRRLGSKMEAAAGSQRGVMETREGKMQKSTAREWSLMDEAARCVMEKSMTKWERECLPLRDGESWSWMGRYRELLLLRRPLTFKTVLAKEGTWGTARSDHVMRAGKHFASVTLTGAGGVAVGIIRPTNGLDMEKITAHASLLQQINEKWTNEGVNYCSLGLPDGSGFWSRPEFTRSPGRLIGSITWEGQSSFARNDTAGLLLDLDEGTLTVYQNGRRMGILVSGLAGEYCWGLRGTTFDGDASVRIRRGLIPAHTSLHDIAIECFLQLGRCRNNKMAFRAVPEGRFTFLHYLMGLLCGIRDPSPASNMVKKLSQWGLIVCLFDKDGNRVDSVRGRSDWDRTFFMVKHVAIRDEWAQNPPTVGRPLAEVFPPMTDDQIRELNEDPSKVRQFQDDW